MAGARPQPSAIALGPGGRRASEEGLGHRRTGTAPATTARLRPQLAGYERPDAPGSLHMMFFFSNRLGCLGSLLVSVVATLVLLVLVGAVRL